MTLKNNLFVASLMILVSFTSLAQSNSCSSATVITPDLTYCNYQAGSSAQATQSIPTCSGGGNADDDVWYEFIANSSQMTIKVDPTSGYDPVIQLFSGGCGSLTSIHCQDINGLNGAETLEANGLTVGQTYKFRVYHYGIGSGTSTFQVCVFGLAPPNNNTPCNAYALPSVSPSCNYLTFTNAGSAGSSIPAPPSGSCGGSGTQQGGYAGGDVWFSVVCPPSGELDIHTQSIDFSDGAMALYSGSCSSPTFIECDDDGEPGDGIIMPHIYHTGLTPGQTYYIRVWEYGNNNNGEFGLCVTSPDNDDCVNAQQICDLNGYGGVTSSAYTIDTPDNMCGIGDPNSPTPGCVFGTGYTGTSPVQIDNNSWLQFTANSTTAELFVEISSCQNGNGMQMQIFEGTNCSNFIPVSNFLETTSSQTVVATGLTIGQTYYIVVDGFAGDICSYTITATSGIQVAEAVATEDIICQGESTTINGVVYGTGSYSYYWHDASNTYSSSSNPITVSPSTTTEYILEVSGYCGTTTSASVLITVNDNPTVNAGSDVTICDNESTTLNATANGGSGSPYTFIWDNGLGTGSSQSVSPNSTTNYNVTVSDVNGCTDSDNVTVNVNQAPTAFAGQDVAICAGQSTTLNASGGGTYAWSNGGTGASITVTPSTTTTYTVTVTNASGCTDTDQVTVTVNPLPNAFAGNDLTVCNGGSTSITATGGVSYFWSGGLGAGASHTLTNITSNATYTVTVTDANGCSATDDINITVGSALSPDAGQDVTICQGESTTLVASGGVTYSWSNGVNSASQTVNPSSTTTYTVNVTDGGTCSGSDQVTITVNLNPTASVSPMNTTICSGENVTLSASGGTDYFWDTGETTSSILVTPSTTTNYNVTVSTTSNGKTCSDNATATVNVNSNPTLIATPQSSTICSGDDIQISASGNGVTSYVWTNSNDNSTLTGASQSINPLTNTWYYVTGTDGNGCVGMDSIVVNVNESPQIDLSSLEVVSASCANGGGTISGVTVAGGTQPITYFWTNGVAQIGNTPTIGGLTDGTYYLTVTDDNNCQDTISVNVGYINASTVVANDDDTTTLYNHEVKINVVTNDTGDVQTVTIVSQANNGFVTYTGNGIYIYTPNPGFIGTDSFAYQICDVACENECDEATVTIVVNNLDGVIIPNSFSPNDDSYNDKFVIVNLEQYDNNSIVIYNRWGDKVYEASPYQNDWDGTSENAKMVINGNQVVDGTYYFVLDLGIEDKDPINGFIDLRRK
jgi:gliding motility-associated-like protein